MKLDEAPLPPDIRRAVSRLGYTTLYPPQAEALSRGLLDGKRLVVATPTASGKTLIAMMAAHNHLLKGGKCLYLTPLRALAAEKLSEFRNFLSEEGYKIVASTGDYDSDDPWLASYDVIIATNEKADSLIRHRASWIDEITLVVADEIHILGEGERGPTLEMTLTRLMDRLPHSQLLALSATARNADELSDWLKAELISLDWRPVPLREGVAYGDKVFFGDDEIKLASYDYDPAISIALNTVVDGGQALIFASTRRRAENYAEKSVEALKRLDIIGEDEKAFLRAASAELYSSVEPSDFTDRVCGLLREGACFHHAGLGAEHRRAVERLFRAGTLKIISATPTLAAGVNLPARTVIIPDLWRYDSSRGRTMISVTEYKQFCGRAGRPGFDKAGYAISVARSREEAEQIVERYIRGKPERIWSKLGNERVLRIHVLAVLASEKAWEIDALEGLFRRTFFAYQYGLHGVLERIKSALNFLAEHRFVLEVDGMAQATPLGKRVAELYIDPLTAIRFLKAIEHPPKLLTDIGLLQIISMSTEMPMIPVRGISKSMLASFINEYADCLFEQLGEDEDLEWIIKSVVVLKAWIEETPEGELFSRFGLEPGDLAALRERCSWLAYSASELMKLVGKPTLSKMFQTLSARLEYGVREELIPLVGLSGVGRVRARSLYISGYRSLDSLRAARVEELAKVPTIGVKIAERIKSQLGESPQTV
ncbi:putative helicase HelY [archaeon HR01]|nr:putative helicase HelY [archaeon HR01]